MLKKLRDILNTYSTKELNHLALWVNSNSEVQDIIVDEFSIDLITKDMILNVIPEEYHLKKIKELEGVDNENN